MHLFLSDTTQGPYATLPPEESKHCVRVLRMQLGDELYVTSGDGTMPTTTTDPSTSTLPSRRPRTTPAQNGLSRKPWR